MLLKSVRVVGDPTSRTTTIYKILVWQKAYSCLET